MIRGKWILVLLFTISWLMLSAFLVVDARSQCKEGFVCVEFEVDEGLDIPKDVFNEVSNSLNDAGFGVSFFVIEADLPNIFPLLYRGEDFYREQFRIHRHSKNYQHVILASLSTGTLVYGVTINWEEVGDTFTQYHLNSVGSIVFVDNIRMDKQGDGGILHGINWSDSVVTSDELLIKVIVHEIGHELGLSENYGDVYSSMHQGDDVKTVQGPNNKGPRFSQEDISEMRFDKILGINRVTRDPK